MAEIEHDLWHQIVARRDGLRAQLLQAFEIDDGRQGVIAAVKFLRRHGYPAAVVEAGPVPVLGLTEPTKPIQEKQQC